MVLQEGGKRYLRLSGFKTSNGPDVHVYLVKGFDAVDAGKEGKYVDLGSLKGNVGDQDYEIPSSPDTKDFHAVTIWCARFGVNFGEATLLEKNAKVAARQQGSM